MVDRDLNTVGFVVSRYGNLPLRDLATLIRVQSPYQLAEVGRQPGQAATVDVEVMHRHFTAARLAERREAGVTPEVDAAVTAFLAGAEERANEPLRPDDLSTLRARVADHAR